MVQLSSDLIKNKIPKNLTPLKNTLNINTKKKV